MPSLDFSIDLHCHPTYKPMGKSFKKTPGSQGRNTDDETNMWFYDPPSVADKLLNNLTGLTKFSQANLSAALYGNVWVMVVSLGSIEKWFFNNRLGTDIIADIMGNFAAGVGKKRIDAIQQIGDYFIDLEREYDYISQRADKPVTVDGKKYTYRWVRNFSELKQVVATNEETIEAMNNDPDGNHPPIIMALIPSIEGLHVLNCGLTTAGCDPDKVKENVRALKNHPNRPWFVTFSHHFYNELCGHAKSLRGPIAKKCDQSFGLGTSFTDLGKEVLDILLNNDNGNRILIDMKHLSPPGRKDLIEMYETKYLDAPLIISHGACSGLPDMNSKFSRYPELGKHMNNGEINFTDDELLAVARSNGIIGLQLDERRIASEEKLKETKNSLFRNKIMHYRSELLWLQVQYIAELLDDNGLFAWGNIAMGSDYDGIVDPLNSFWTFEEYKDLKAYLERHAHNYITNHSSRLKCSFNKIDADTIVQNIFQRNAWNFFEKWF